MATTRSRSSRRPIAAPRGCSASPASAYPSFIAELADRPEIGWRLDSAVWGRGYATEAAHATLDDARERLRLEELISIIHPDNARSQRVAEKLGMTIERQVRHPALGTDIDVWRIAL